MSTPPLAPADTAGPSGSLSRVLAATLVLALGALLAGPAPAQPAPTPTATTTSATTTPAALLYKDADLALGDKLLREHRCAECHVRKVGGDGTSIYRPLGRINSPGALRGMVEQCNLELNLTLFPDEVTAISAVLNRDHYRFK